MAHTASEQSLAHSYLGEEIPADLLILLERHFNALHSSPETSYLYQYFSWACISSTKSALSAKRRHLLPILPRWSHMLALPRPMGLIFSCTIQETYADVSIAIADELRSSIGPPGTTIPDAPEIIHKIQTTSMAAEITTKPRAMSQCTIPPTRIPHLLQSRPFEFPKKLVILRANTISIRNYFPTKMIQHTITRLILMRNNLQSIIQEIAFMPLATSIRKHPTTGTIEHRLLCSNTVTNITSPLRPQLLDGQQDKAAKNEYESASHDFPQKQKRRRHVEQMRKPRSTRIALGVLLNDFHHFRP